MTTTENGTSKIVALSPELSAARTVFEQILDLDPTQGNLSVCLAAKKTGDPQAQVRKIDMTEQAANDFRAALGQALAPLKKARREGNLRVLDFDVTRAVDEQTIEYLPVSAYSSLPPQLEPLKNFAGMENLHGYDEPFVGDLRFYSIIIEPRTSAFSAPIYYYRWYSHTFMLKDSSQHALRFLGLGNQPGTYDIIHEPVFLFDRHIDCVSYHDRLFILQKYNFLTIFDLEEELKQIAEKALDILDSMDFIHNFPRFRADCLKNKIKYRILCKIYYKPYFQDLSMDMLEPIIADYNRPVKVQWMGNKPDLRRKILYSSNEPWEILRLLDDQFWTSPMTEIDYQASDKNTLGKRSGRPRSLTGGRRKRP